MRAGPVTRLSVRTRIRARIPAVRPHILGRWLPQWADLAAGHNDPVADLLCPVLIGREGETGRLRPALTAARGGAGGVVFLTGEAGIGKSRLASELAAEARALGALVLAGRAVPTSASIPYRPLTEALLLALRKRAIPDDPSLTPWLPALRAMIPTIADPGGDGHGDYAAPVRGEAVLQLLRRLAGDAGLLLVLEDLHWADPDTLAVVEYLSDNLSAEAVLCVATCRGENCVGRSRAGHPADRAPRCLAAGSRPDLRTRLPPWCGRACRWPRMTSSPASSMSPTGFRSSSRSPSPLPACHGRSPTEFRSRLDRLSNDERLVLYTAALLGRQFDWRLLPCCHRAGRRPDRRRPGTRCRIAAARGRRRCLPVPAHADQGGGGR